MSGQIIPDIVDQHAEEAALCWLWRHHGVTEPHYAFRDLVDLDGQLAAHLDGLRVAGDVAWNRCEAGLAWREPGEFFTAAVLAFESGDDQRISLVLESASEIPLLWRPIASALGWLPLERSEQFIRRLVTDTDPQIRWIGITSAAIHRHDLGPTLATVICDQDSHVRARALRAIGELGRTDLRDAARDEFESDAEACSGAAAWSAARLAGGDRLLELDLVERLRGIVEPPGRDAERCMQILVRRAENSDAQQLIQIWCRNPPSVRLATTAVGALGDPVLIPWLIERFDIPPLARLAGEAFTMITGLEIDERPFEGKWPEGFEAGPSEDPRDDNVELDPDENLPWPNRTAIADWWVKHRDDFKPGTRCLLGRPLDDESWLLEVLRHGYQRQRAAAALELAIRHPGQPLFNVTAPARRQKQLLGLK